MIIRIMFSVICVYLVAIWCVKSTAPPKSELGSRFVKITHHGKQLSPWQGPWDCIFDKQQGLLWEAKTDNESIHDGYWTYSWYDGVKGKQNFGDCYFEPERCDTLDLINKVNAEKLCGVTGWRLPNITELGNLIANNDRPGENHLATDYFLQIKSGDYWSENHSQPLIQDKQGGALAINFKERKQRTLPYRNAAFVILVNDTVPELL